MITGQNGGDAGAHRRDRHRPPSGAHRPCRLLIGYNRRERAKAAGLRTMLLVCLAASVSMIQVNLLMPTNGKPPDSYVTLDLMRLPLGILTGVGFIGGGAILRRGDIVIGVTTAATLWFVTVLGLCFGGGQIELGLVALVLGFVGLWGLELVVEHLRAEHARTSRRDGSRWAGRGDVQRELVRAGLMSVSRQVTLWDGIGGSPSS